MKTLSWTLLLASVLALTACGCDREAAKAKREASETDSHQRAAGAATQAQTDLDKAVAK